MKITKSQLKELIKEEIKKIQLNEYFYYPLYMAQEPIEELIKKIKEETPKNQGEDGYLSDEFIKEEIMKMVEIELEKYK